jgi:hypothetical protein
LGQNEGLKRLRAIVIGWTGLMALPAMAEDQAALAARILALSSTQQFDDLSPDVRAIFEDYANKEEIGIKGVQGRMTVTDCMLTAETAAVSLGFDYVVEQVTVDLSDPDIQFSSVDALRPADGTPIGIFSNSRDVTVKHIQSGPLTDISSAVETLKALHYATEEAPIYLFPMVRAYGNDDQRGAVIQAIENYRALYCTNSR